MAYCYDQLSKTKQKVYDAIKEGLKNIAPSFEVPLLDGKRLSEIYFMVRIAGKYYHLDVTFDNSLGKNKEIRYDYFNLSDSQILKDHEPVIYKIPICNDADH